MQASPFTGIDYLFVVFYLLLVIGAGSWIGKGQKTVGEYFLASRKMNWLVVCISIAATDLSAISFTGVPAWLYSKDLKYSMGVFLLPFVLLFVLKYFVRTFHRFQVFTTYEYLEHRFHTGSSFWDSVEPGCPQLSMHPLWLSQLSAASQ